MMCSTYFRPFEEVVEANVCNRMDSMGRDVWTAREVKNDAAHDSQMFDFVLSFCCTHVF